jgi:DNA-binding NarL/FixJ family response regulator
MNPPVIKILLIDDEPAQAWLVGEHLRSVASKTGKSVELAHAESLQEGLERLEQGDIDLLLLDLSLPDSMGIDTFLRAYARFPSMPIVVLTSIEDEDIGIKLIQAGAQDYLAKGQSTGVILYRSIRHAIERKQAAAERERLIQELQSALIQVKTLKGLIPICAGCKKIRDDHGYWKELESYISTHSDAQFSHGFCPECASKLFPDIAEEVEALVASSEANAKTP